MQINVHDTFKKCSREIGKKSLADENLNVGIDVGSLEKQEKV